MPPILHTSQNNNAAGYDVSTYQNRSKIDSMEHHKDALLQDLQTKNTNLVYQGVQRNK